MPIWHQSPKLTPRYFLETPRLFGYPRLESKWVLDSKGVARGKMVPIRRTTT